MDLHEQAKNCIFMLEEAERMKQQLTEMNKKVNSALFKLHDDMQSADVPEIVIERNNQKVKLALKADQDFSLAGKLAGRQWDSTEEWFNWLVDIGEEGLIKTKRSVHAATRTKFLQEWTEQGNVLPDFIEEKYNSRVHYNKKQIERMVKGE